MLFAEYSGENARFSCEFTAWPRSISRTPFLQPADDMRDENSQFVRLWTRFQPEVRRYVYMLVPRPADAEDILQETSARLWEKFDEYDSERPFGAWAIKFAYLEVLKWRQKQSRDRLVFSDALLEELDETISAEGPLLELRRRVLDFCLEQLDDRGRQLLLDRYGQHGAVKERASHEGISVHKLYHLVAKLRTQLLNCVEGKMLREGWQHG